MKRVRKWSYVAAALALAACGGDDGRADADTAGETGSGDGFPTFVRHAIDELPSGYQAVATDVDGDGRKDVAALSTSESAVIWYRNPDWERFPVSPSVERPINMAPHDIDGDGDLDLAIASEFSLGNSTGGGLVQWAEAPENPTADQDWGLHRIDAVPTSHRLKWADIDGDGAEELINLPIVGVGASSPEYEGAVEFKAYHVPSDPTGSWEEEVLDDSRLEVAHGIAVVDWDGDDVDDLLTASFRGVHLFRPALEGQPGYVTRIARGRDGPRPNGGSSEVALGRSGDGSRFVAAIDPWHGNQVVVYTPPDSGEPPWSRRVIDTEYNSGHALVTADLDGDGSDEIVAGYRGDGFSLYGYRYRPDAGAWRRFAIDEGGIGVSSLDIADLDGDDDPDVLAIGSSTDNVVWYENAGSTRE